MNNTVYTGGGTYGFRCRTCGGIFDRMWGEECNGCRQKEEMYNELIAAIRASREGKVK